MNKKQLSIRRNRIETTGNAFVLRHVDIKEYSYYTSLSDNLFEIEKLIASKSFPRNQVRTMLEVMWEDSKQKLKKFRNKDRYKKLKENIILDTFALSILRYVVIARKRVFVSNFSNFNRLVTRRIENVVLEENKKCCVIS